MQSAFAFGLAKNGVNGLPGVRRAATASQIGGRLSCPSSPTSTGNGWGDDAFDEAVIGSPTSLVSSMTALPRVASSPIAFADLGSDQSALAAKAAAARAGSVIRNASPSHEAVDDLHLGKRGTSVDKTNPFIGYFQTGTENEEQEVPIGDKMAASPLPLPPPAPVRRVPMRTQSSATLSSMASFYPSTLFTHQKKMTEWLGSQGGRLPAFFNQRGVKETTQHNQQQDEHKKRKAFIESLKLETPALTVQETRDESQEEQVLKRSSFKRTVSLPAAMSSKAAAAALSPIVTSSPEMNTTSTLIPGDTCASNSRFEQDFEVVGSLGEGGQGSVFKVRSKVDGCYYAIKKVVLPRATELDAKRAESQALREVRLMASMAPHQNVVRYHTAWTEVDECMPHKCSSTESVRGSDVPSLESDCAPQDLQRQQLELLDEEAALRMNGVEAADQSFSLEFSADSLEFDEYSTPGFTFEDEGEDEDSVGLSVDDEAAFGQPGELKNEVNLAPAAAPAEPVVMRSQVILYIQMELCGTAVNSVPSTPTSADSHQPIHHFLDQLKTPQQERQQFGEETHSNLGAWLRSSLEDRSVWSNTSDIHLEGLKLFLEAVQGVGHMHSYGVIHRDLKPDNIFIHGDLAKIGDFGLSKSVFADSTSPGAISPRERLLELGLSDGDHTTALGTFTYASPEQLGYRFSSSNLLKNAATRLKSAKYSIKSDIFALGVILLELCCPFSTMMERSQVLTGVRHGVVPQKARQHFPMEMDLVLRMTSIDPGERPTSEEVCDQPFKKHGDN
ncbi:Eukaryotic translation initiation factor 2-alpha kinase 1 [Phytophthora citrophthora]|uniref:non-specific serine/threonine protein kinase n=1 Tax=Phytophthora citrophthora TaxID=4793 RepID=A0AAD9G3D6_9STRA|nr:Eukaryotic translation initiation factor 2-alpha kinase 1 [Phytophthora citrophthora]